jgi:hypothetical protein
MKLHVFILLLFWSFSCQEIEPKLEKPMNLCGVNDPIKNLPWLNTLTKEIPSNPRYVMVVISVSENKGQEIFNIYDMISSCAYCDLRDCAGQDYEPADFGDFVTNKKDERKIWCQNQDLCVD